jgi:hypothetical protein
VISRMRLRSAFSVGASVVDAGSSDRLCRFFCDVCCFLLTATSTLSIRVDFCIDTAFVAFVFSVVRFPMFGGSLS